MEYMKHPNAEILP